MCLRPSDECARAWRRVGDRGTWNSPGNRWPTVGAAVRGAVLAVLVWTAVTALGLPETFGFPTRHAYVVAPLVGGLLGAFAAERLLRVAAGLAALVLVLVTSLPLATVMAPTLVRRDQPAVDSGATVDAIAVLSSSVGEDGLIQGTGIDRLLDALALAKRTGRPLIVSVVRNPHGAGTSSLADQRWLTALTGQSDRLFVVDSVHTTRDEAVRMSALARAHGWRRVALVTSPTHSRRACATFERAGLPVVCTPARARDASWGGPAPLRSPDDRLHVAANWLHETIGWIVYRARGWV